MPRSLQVDLSRPLLNDPVIGQLHVPQSELCDACLYANLVENLHMGIVPRSDCTCKQQVSKLASQNGTSYCEEYLHLLRNIDRHSILNEYVLVLLVSPGPKFLLFPLKRPKH
jgi:hypothetical protein